MAEPSTITGAACAATVAICWPFMLELGLDPADAVFAALGCVVAQLLLPPEGPRDVVKIVAWSVGGVLLSTLMTPWIFPMVSSKPDASFRHVLSAGIGAFAQPMALLIRARVLRYLEERKGAGNA